MEKMNLAILGAGGIASTMAKTVAQMDEVNLYAVAARDGARARAFADRFGAEKSYGSYDEMLRDDQVDLVYIATPHSHHCEHAKLCIEHGRPALCEKAFTRNAREAREVLDFAHEKGVFITEAMWVRYMPMSVTLKKLLESGRIGKIVGLTANLGYSLMHVERMVRPELAGGALLDLGVYTMNFATWVLGDEVQSLSASVVWHNAAMETPPRGAQGQDASSILMRYARDAAVDK
ncbi:MAG: Gfo/Idh/MocA family oxidoreductase, partial [Lachnospiraceae bacterium]|nr:Gfo/Idh/MocA family oxidoreductase [Lachnospiraceae bacterium]